MKKKLLVVMFSILSLFSLFAAEKPTVALVLSGGGAKGYVHIATIKMLEKYNIPVDYVVGTSMGAIVGGLYAAGYTADEMIEAVNSMNITDAVFSLNTNTHQSNLTFDNIIKTNDFNIGFDKNGITSLTGLVDDTKILNALNHLFVKVNNIDNFDDLPRAFRAVSVDINTGETVALKSGHIAEAVRSSMSIPLVFPIFHVGDNYLVDGGVKENLPLDTAIEEFHPDIIITSDCTGHSFRIRSGSDLKTKLDEGSAGVDSIFASSMMVSNTSKYDHDEIEKISSIMVEYDTTPFGTASFSRANEIIDSAMKKVEEYDSAFRTLGQSLVKERGFSDKKAYKSFQSPFISSVRMNGKDRYRTGVSETLSGYFQKFNDRTLDEATLKELENEILMREYFFGASYMYYVLNEKEDGSNELEIKYDFPPQRSHNFFSAGETKLSMQMVSNSKDSSKKYFGFSFFPDSEIGYKHIISPLTSMDSLSLKFRTDALFKDNTLSFSYTHVMNTGRPYVLLLSPRLSLYAGISAPEAFLSITNYFSYYDYGADVSLSFAYANRLHTLLLNAGLTYRYFGTDHALLTSADRRHMLLPYLSLDFVLGRPSYYSLVYDTGYRAELSARVGFDLGANTLKNNAFLSKTSYPYKVEGHLEGTYKVHKNVVLGFDGSFGFSREASDLMEGLLNYGEVKAMPGFSINDKVYDYAIGAISLIFPFGSASSFTPLFSLRLAVGTHDKFEDGDNDLTNPYDLFSTSYAPFSNLKGVNLGLGAYFGFHTPYADIVIGAGYEFFEKRFAINVEIW